jgi:hypothetical protein
MTFNDLVLFLLATAGLSVIVTKSYIFKPMRDVFDIGDEKRIAVAKGELSLSFSERASTYLHKLLTCPLCFGFWAGMLVYLMFPYVWGYFLCLCLAGSIASLAIYSISKR